MVVGAIWNVGSPVIATSTTLETSSVHKCRTNKSLLLSLMDPTRFLLPQGARRVKCATEFGC